MYSDCIYKIVIDIVDNTDINSEETLFDLPCIIEIIYSIIKDIYPEVKENDYLLYSNILNIYIKYLKDYKSAPVIFIDSPSSDKLSNHKLLDDKLLDDKLPDNKLLDDKLPDNKLLNDKLLDNKLPDNKLLDNKLPDDKSFDNKYINDTCNNDKSLKKNTIILDNIKITNDNNSFSKKKNKKTNDYDDYIKKSIIENGLNIKYSKIIELDSTEKQNIINNLERIKKIPQPIQRSPEWYSFRKDHITASDLSKITKKSESKERDLIINKCTDVPFKKITGKACEHGIKYEEVSCKIYEKRNKVKILEFGCIPHEIIKHFAASPDGICDEKSGNFVGRMVEIKNPVSREITGIPPYEYWVQMQGQLEVTNLEYCDFLECNITEYPSKNAFFEDGTHSMTSDNLEKGVIINILDIENNNKIYKYCDLGLSKKELEIWIDKEIEYIYKSHDLEYIGTTWWKLNTYSCSLIKRDKIWFDSNKSKIEEFWNKVEYYRINGIQTLESKKKKKKKKEKIEDCNSCIIID